MSKKGSIDKSQLTEKTTMSRKRKTPAREKLTSILDADSEELVPRPLNFAQ